VLLASLVAALLSDLVALPLLDEHVSCLMRRLACLIASPLINTSLRIHAFEYTRLPFQGMRRLGASVRCVMLGASVRCIMLASSLRWLYHLTRRLLLQAPPTPSTLVGIVSTWRHLPYSPLVGIQQTTVRVWPSTRVAVYSGRLMTTLCRRASRVAHSLAQPHDATDHTFATNNF
jgi:hypothetical protein